MTTMRVKVAEVEIAVDVRGDGPPVLLLHGWPDDRTVWRHQVDALAAAGFRTVTPDLRGFGESDRPERVEQYGIPTLLGDVLAVLDELQIRRAALVGHDWGGALAWTLASRAPERVERLVVCSVSSPAAFADAGIAQREKSWYMLLFQFPGVAEQWLSADGFRNLRAWTRHPDADAVVARLSRPGALTASLNIYRANVPPESLIAGPPELPPVPAPTLGLWGSEDPAITEAAITGCAAHVTGPWRYERLDGAGHWMMLEQPDRVNELLSSFLGGDARGGSVSEVDGAPIVGR